MINTPTKLIIHHTGGTNANPLADTSHHTFEMVQSYHKSRGWDDIGYHWYCEKDGKITAGRAENSHGAHTIGHNTSSIGFCFAGNFDATHPTKEQEEAFKVWYREFNKRYKDLPIHPHRKYANKSCYGNNLSDTWASDLAKKSEPKPEIEDGSPECEAYLKKERNSFINIIIAFLNSFR